MKTFFTTIFSFLIFLTTHAQESEYRTDIPVHDPVVIKQGDTFYLFCTGFGVAVWSSPDLKQWKREAPVFAEAPTWTAGINPEFKNHIWAPDISYHNGQYYLYYSVSAFAKNTSAIGLAVNKTLDPSSPDFKWEDQGIVIQSVPGRDLWNAIDPNLVFDEEGTPWLNYGSFWNGMKLVKLADDLKTIQNGPEDWYTISRRERSFDLDDRNPGDGAVEAPFIFKKDGWYYLFVSFDYCCRGVNSTYKMVVGRSRDVKGPYLDRDGRSMFEGGGTLVLEGNADWHGVGHNSAYTFDNKDFLIFHGYDAHDNGRSKLLIREMNWDSEGWPIVKLEE
ncbi:arabinan endo-1,5-alpha-L-arabinosidase [Belliella buryatensis]|uniref:Arabinan endo-1,5-alpha-L-arabinosidase n=1 Tax=Belliella buryatensis TaxID=1500549 RepID=A0A239GI58_9BACT|nr:arabinan endo-1,5-alpha-L-arabinosidase [Belliella buryatensis]SNS68829.1 arabinan endo-1,5-alpha-L-arabinosidase [Belliella buryatensis]